MPKQKKREAVFKFLLALCFIVGVLIGTLLPTVRNARRTNVIGESREQIVLHQRAFRGQPSVVERLFNGVIGEYSANDEVEQAFYWIATGDTLTVRVQFLKNGTIVIAEVLEEEEEE